MTSPVQPLPAPAPDGAPEAVIDTNVLLDWLLFDDPRARPLAQAVTEGRLRWVCTEAMLDELSHVLARPFDPRWTVDAATILETVRRHARIVPPPAAPGPPMVCRDPDDQKFIDLALARPVRWLFSRDRALLDLARRARTRGVTVVAPAQWSFEGL